MDIERLNKKNCQDVTDIKKYGDCSTSSSSVLNKRKRRSTLDDKDVDHEAKRRYISSCSQPLSQVDSETSSSIPSPLADLTHEFGSVIDTRSSSECLSTLAEYDLCGFCSPSSQIEASSPNSCHSNSSTCNSWLIRGDVTPHGNKRCTRSYVEIVPQCCITPTAELRPCPLPALSWANALDVWKVMCRKDEIASMSRSPKMLENHPGLQSRMRAILLDWLIEVCEVYKLHRETYYLAVDYLDRYLYSNRKVQKTHLQLIGITCLFVAAKVEEIYPPKIGEFAYVTDGACQEEDILQQELLLLKALDWSISPVTILGWLGVYMQLNVSNRTPSSFVNRDANLKSKASQEDDTTSVNNSLSSSTSNLKKSQENNTVTNMISSNSNNSETSINTNSVDSINLRDISRNDKKCGRTQNFNQTSEDNELDDGFIYPQFSGMEFVQTAQLTDLCSLDLGVANFPYSVIAAAAISHTFTREAAVRVSGLDWSVIAPCAQWMEPFFDIVRDESQHVFLLEQNDQVKSKFGLGHICPNIVTDDSHIIQTHTTSIDMFDKAIMRHEYLLSSATLKQQEASPAVTTTCPEGLLTPPSSSRKPMDNVVSESDLHTTSIV